MKMIPCTIELLEPRIAPAGLVTAVYVEASGELTLTGDADANEVTIFQTGTNAYRIEGVTTDINTVGTTFLDIGILKKLTIDGGDEADTFTGINLKSLTSLTLSGGIGNDTFNMENVVVKGPLAYHGGAGGDHLNFRGLSAEITGDLTADSAAGAGEQHHGRFLFARRDGEGKRLFHRRRGFERRIRHVRRGFGDDREGREFQWRARRRDLESRHR
jgi:hypothetical protein